jgi:hypothetical protein
MKNTERITTLEGQVADLLKQNATMLERIVALESRPAPAPAPLQKSAGRPAQKSAPDPEFVRAREALEAAYPHRHFFSGKEVLAAKERLARGESVVDPETALLRAACAELARRTGKGSFSAAEVAAMKALLSAPPAQ